MVNPDGTCIKLEKMCQNEAESVAQYHVRLRLQVAKCGFLDPDDVIRSKILHTMRDKKLRQEAMMKRYTLQQLPAHAANKEDVDHQAQHMEKTLPSVPPARNQVNRVYQKRHQKPKDKLKPKTTHDDKKSNSWQFCGLDHKGPRSQCPASGKTCGCCSKKSHFARMCKSKKKPKDSQHSQQSSAKYVRQEEQEESSDTDFAFQLQADKSNSLTHSTMLRFRFALAGWKKRWKQTPTSQQTLWMSTNSRSSNPPSRRRYLWNLLTPSCMHSLKTNLSPSLVVLMQKLKVSAQERKLWHVSLLLRELPSLHPSWVLILA